MYGQQLDVFTVHQFENVPAMQDHLDKHREYFTKTCTKLFYLLMSGKELTVLGAHVNYSISSLPRRIKDLKENGVSVQDRWDGPIKVWYMSEDGKRLNENFKNKCR